MANNTGLLRSDLLRELRSSLPTRAIAADGAVLFVVDGAGRYGYFDAALTSMLAANDAPRLGAPFRPEAFVPVNRVARSIAEGLDGRVPEPCLVVSRDPDHQGVVWQLEAFPIRELRVPTGHGAVCMLTRASHDEGRPIDPAIAAEALAERLERERRETAQAVAVTIRHEINNALTSLIGNAELILRRTDAIDPLVVSRVEEIVRQGRRIQAVLARSRAVVRMIWASGRVARSASQ